MGRIAQVIATERNSDGALDVRVDPGGAAAFTVDHFAGSGEDTNPLPGDKVALEDSAGAGAEQVSGYHDQTPGQALPGEVRRYSRSSDGVVVAELWLKTDGSLEFRSLNGQPLRLVTTGPIVLDSPDVRLSDVAGAGLARVGDLVAGTLSALSATAGAPIAPNPAPTPATSVPFVGQIVSGSTKAKA